METTIQTTGSDHHAWPLINGGTTALTIGKTYRTRTDFTPTAGPTVVRLVAIDRTGKRFADDKAIGVVEVVQAPSKPEIVGRTTEVRLGALAWQFEETILVEDAVAEILA